MLKIRIFDDEKVIAEMKGQKFTDFDKLLNDVNYKYMGKKIKK